MNLVKSIAAGVLVLALAVFSLPAAEAAPGWDGVSRPAASSCRYGAETGAPVVGRRQVRR